MTLIPATRVGAQPTRSRDTYFCLRSEMGGGDFLTALGIVAFIVVAYVFAVWLGGRR